tara:strand:+ start:418 stop:633 length:216 start_codon:yes stop_codon:yes gene_type:complete
LKGGAVMPKMKTHRGAAKRVKLTAKGGLKRGHAYTSHILTKKSPKRKRNLRKSSMVSKGDMKRVRKLLPYL